MVSRAGAEYVSGSGTGELVFEYVIADGDGAGVEVGSGVVATEGRVG